MHKRSYPFFLALLTLLMACEEDLPFDDYPEAETRNVANFDALRIKGDVTIFLNSDSIAGGPGDLIIRSDDPTPGDGLEVNSDGNTLRINARNSALGRDRLLLFLYPSDLTSVVVEGNSQVRLLPYMSLSDLSLKTEGDSDLEVYSLCVERLETKREGNSHMLLSSALDTVNATLGLDSATVLNVQPYQDQVVIWTDTDIFYADSAYGGAPGELVLTGPLVQYCLVASHTLRNEGGGEVTAFAMPTLHTEVKNEGTAQAEVSVWDELVLKGEGSSTLRYRGRPTLDTRLEGGAQLIDAN